MNWLFSLFRKPSALAIAATDLEEAKRHFLKSVSSAEFHAFQAAYYQGVVERLTDYIQENGK